jgi:predicted enzyme related to lactoylglutathione lyase
VTSIAEGAPPVATWNTYIRVDSADETAAKVWEAGGEVISEPFDTGDAGRMAVVADAEGAVFCLWQPNKHPGARIVNEHGSVNFNDLHTRNPEKAKAFYGAVFGWETLDIGSGLMWTLPGYGDHLGINPKDMAEMGAPAGFEDVVATLIPLGDDQPDVPPHWNVTFAVDDADATAQLAEELGATVVSAPIDAPWVRMTVLRDPQGATFVASQFVPENKDLGATLATSGEAR